MKHRFSRLPEIARWDRPIARSLAHEAAMRGGVPMALEQAEISAPPEQMRVELSTGLA